MEELVPVDHTVSIRTSKEEGGGKPTVELKAKIEGDLDKNVCGE